MCVPVYLFVVMFGRACPTNVFGPIFEIIPYQFWAILDENGLKELFRRIFKKSKGFPLERPAPDVEQAADAMGAIGAKK